MPPLLLPLVYLQRRRRQSDTVPAADGQAHPVSVGSKGAGEHTHDAPRFCIVHPWPSVGCQRFHAVDVRQGFHNRSTFPEATR